MRKGKDLVGKPVVAYDSGKKGKQQHFKWHLHHDFCY
jgi:hypothetical protein